MQKMKYKLLSALVIAAPLLLNTGFATTVHACSNSNSGWNSTCNNRDNNQGWNSTCNNRSNNPGCNNSGHPNGINVYPVNYYTPTTVYTSSDYSFADFKTKLDTLVASGIITQEQETTILNLYYNGQITTNSTLKNKLDILVTVGIITQSQEYSILSPFTSWGSCWKIPAPTTPTAPVSSVVSTSTTSNTSFCLEDIKTKLDTLVTAGTITEDQETTILNLFNNGELTTKNLKSQIDILVIVGVITQSQAVLIQH
ncbi:hypothetical protein ACJDU8_20040 [Clostridium sp. WILCCON 0269]|uniref:Uncharacterized protein n=1 Tax=Candidatus Clostridium eludens TaxID=3381663 RepID=A0ABW8SP32_9CLOT